MSVRTKFHSLLFVLLLPLFCYAQTSHTTTPANNATVDALSMIYMDFDETEVSDIYQSEDFSGKKWAVLNEDGDSVAGAFIVYYATPQAILKVQPTIYDKGTYTINLPKGYLWLYDANDIRTIADAETLTFNVSGNTKAPDVDTSFTPDPSEPVDYLSNISFLADGYVAYNVDHACPDKITVTNEQGQEVAQGQPDFTYGTDDDPCHAVITFNKVISAAGTYTVHIPGNMFKIGDDWTTFYQGGYEMLPPTDVTYTVLGSDVTIFEMTGGGTSVCNGITLTFPTHQTVKLANETTSYTIYNTDGYWRNCTDTWDSLITVKDNVLSLKLAYPLTIADSYTFTIPKGDLIFEDGTTNTPLAINFTVIDPLKTNITSEPADSSTVNELYVVNVTFPDVDKVEAVYPDAAYYVTDISGKQVSDTNGYNLSFMVDKVTDNIITMRLTNSVDYTTLTTPGTYSVTLPQGYFYLGTEKDDLNSKIVLTFTIEEGADTHTYVSWGYYSGDDVSTLGAIGADIDTYEVAIFIPGDGLLHGASLAGAKIPVRDANVITSLSAWVKTSLDSPLYINNVEVNNPHVGYNTVRFDENYIVPAEGCYIGYTIAVDNNSVLGTPYPVVIDETNKVENSLYISIPGYGWYDYGPSYGCSALQGLFADLDLSESSATFGSIENAITQVGTTSDWRFPITTNSESAITQIEYEIDANGNSEVRKAVVNIPAGYKQQSEMTVSVKAPEETGTYNVRLTVTKINGKDNTTPTTSVSSFTNVMRTVTRHTLVEELTGTGCGWCPRGLIGLQKLNDAYGDSVICLAYHQYNNNDPMWCNYASYDDLAMNSAPQCAIDRKGYADPYQGNSITANGIVDEVSGYLDIPASADISIKSVWTNADCNKIKIDATLEAFADDDYELVYVVTADDLYAESTTWRQTNYYYQYSADQYPDDLALFCDGGEYGHSYFSWRYDDVVIGSSYDESGLNTSSDTWTMQAGERKNGSFTIELPQNGILSEAIKGSLDKVYAVVFALDGKHHVAQAAKVNVVEIATDGIEEVESDESITADKEYFNISGQRVSTPRKGQIIIIDGKKIVY